MPVVVGFRVADDLLLVLVDLLVQEHIGGEPLAAFCELSPACTCGCVPVSSDGRMRICERQPNPLTGPQSPYLRGVLGSFSRMYGGVSRSS